MRNSKVFFNFGLALIASLVYLTTPTLTKAEQTVYFPSSFQLPGLTFDTSINFSSQPDDLADILTEITFEKTESLVITQKTASVNLTDILVPPAIAESTTSATIVASLFSTIPVEDIKIATPVPSSKPIPTVRPTKAPKPTTTATPTSKPTSAPLASSGGLSADKLFDMANSYRATKGLPAFQKESRTCELAASRAPEINAEIAGGHMHSGLRARNLPYWNTENIISMNSEEGAFNWWINDQIHKEAIESDKIYSCVACAGNACAQEFTSFTPK